MSSDPRREAARLIDIEVDESGHEDHPSDGRRRVGSGDGIAWQTVVLATLGVFAVAALAIAGLGTESAGPAPAPPTDVRIDQTAVDPTEPFVQNGWPSTTALQPAEGWPWPGDTAVIVANDQGVHRVTGERGETVVTRLEIDRPVIRAFEVEDGSIVYQAVDGDILRRLSDGSVITLVTRREGLVLEYADMPGADPARLRIVHREAATDAMNSFLLAVQVGTTTSLVPVPGGWGVSYRRFSVWTDTGVLANWVDDTGQRGVAVVDLISGAWSSSSSPIDFLQMSGDPAEGGTVVVSPEGLQTQLDPGPKSIAAPGSVSGLDLRGSSLAVQRDDGTAEYYDLSPYRRYEIPVVGEATVSRLVHSPRFENSAVESDNEGPRSCMLGLPGNDSRVAPYLDDVSVDQIAGSDPIVVDGFPALLYRDDDSSFIVRITSDVCVLHIRATGIDEEQLFDRLLVANVGHTYGGDVGTDVTGTPST